MPIKGIKGRRNSATTADAKRSFLGGKCRKKEKKAGTTRSVKVRERKLSENPGL